MIVYGTGQSPFGLCQVARSERGICYLGFSSGPESLDQRLARIAAGNKLIRADDEIKNLLPGIFTLRPELPLDLRGTPFQMRVWRTLLAIPAGETRSYAAVAAASGHPRAVRAVAGAVAANPVAWLVPCHRVIRKDGSLGGYHWGGARKRAMLEFESHH